MTALDYELELSLIRLRRKKNRRKLILGLLIWCVSIWLLLHRMYGISVVSGNSMRPSFYTGDIVIYQRGCPKDLSYDDVVVMQSWLERYKLYVKRVKGLPGDVVDVDEKGYLLRDGNSVDEPEVLPGYQATDSDIHFPYRLGENEYFCIGDNRPVSLDSRTFGAALKTQIRGRVVLTIRFEFRQR